MTYVFARPEIGGITVWNRQINGEHIPGTTKIPTDEIVDYFKGDTKNLIGLDAGSGQGRSTRELQKALPGSKIVALDLSLEGLRLTETKFKVQAKIEELPFEKNTFDFVTMCGVMTNIVAKTAEKARALREKVMHSLFSIVKPGGLVIISDFSAAHLIDDYPVNYQKHKLITGEYGTIAVLRNGQSFIGKSNNDIAAMKGTDAIERFAHHYTPEELVNLLQSAGFKVFKYTIELTQTPRGKRLIENIIVSAMKPPA